MGVHLGSEGSDSCGIVAGTVESGSSFQMPPELHDQPFVCCIGKDRPCSITAKDTI